MDAPLPIAIALSLIIGLLVGGVFFVMFSCGLFDGDDGDTGFP